MHESVIAAMVDYMTRRNSNTHGLFETSVRTDAVIDAAHQAVADLLGCSGDEVIFGNNMTSLTFHVSRSLAQELGPEDEVVVTRLDHDANVMPWVLAAQDRGALVRWADVDVESGTLDMEDVRRQITPRTKMVAVGYASNATGTVNDVGTIIGWAGEVGALTFVDAVQYAPHGLIDVRALGCDFLACSSYKFFGPHSGQLFGKREHLQRLQAYRVRPAGDQPPDKWETGTQNHEAMAGVTAAIDYLAGLGVAYGGAAETDSRRDKLIAAWSVIGEQNGADRAADQRSAACARHIHLRPDRAGGLGQEGGDGSYTKEGGYTGTDGAGAGGREYFCLERQFLRAVCERADGR